MKPITSPAKEELPFLPVTATITKINTKVKINSTKNAPDKPRVPKPFCPKLSKGVLADFKLLLTLQFLINHLKFELIHNNKVP